MSDKHSQLPQRKAARPVFDTVLEPLVPAEERIVDEAIFSSVRICDAAFEPKEAECLTFKQTIFQKVLFNETVWRHIDLMNVRFEDCDLANVDFSEGILHRVEFINCKLVGMNLSQATLRDVTFEDCSGRYASMSFANCKRVSVLRQYMAGRLRLFN